MEKPRTLDDVTQKFLAHSPTNIKSGGYNLDRMRQLMHFLGDPQEKLNVIHIAGTSGKTSTAYFIRGFLEASGKKTGLTVSPHVVAINERVQINGIPLSAPKFVSYANDFMELAEKTKLPLTYFELLVGMAYWIFAKEKVDYAIAETGLGGLLDGTNVIARPDKISVITDIGLDHTEILGRTRAKIAEQKAGIIQQGNQVFVNRQDDVILREIKKVVDLKKATLNLVSGKETSNSLPAYQQRNWQLALAVWKYLQRKDELPHLTGKQISEVSLQSPPGRWEVFHFKGKTIILDGAHNPQKLQAFRESLRAKRITNAAVLANLVNAPVYKIKKSLEIIQTFTAHLIITEFETEQDVKACSMACKEFSDLALKSGIKSVEIENNRREALNKLLARPETVLIVTGSLYLVRAIRFELQDILHRPKV